VIVLPGVDGGAMSGLRLTEVQVLHLSGRGRQYDSALRRSRTHPNGSRSSSRHGQVARGGRKCSVRNCYVIQYVSIA
jgi:hypothetical protein